MLFKDYINRRVRDFWTGKNLTANNVMRSSNMTPPCDTYQPICGAAILLCCYIGNIGKDNTECDGEDARDGDHCKVPPTREDHHAQIITSMLTSSYTELRGNKTS